MKPGLCPRGRGVTRRGKAVDVERRTWRKIHYVLLFVYSVLREERNPDTTAIGKGRNHAVRVGPAEGLLEVMERFLTTDLL